MDISTVLMNILEPTILTLAGIAGTYLAIWIKRKIGKETLEQKKELVAIAVRMVQQLYKDLNGDEKYAKAIEWLTTELNKKGIKATDTELKGLIESTLKEFKDEFANQW